MVDFVTSTRATIQKISADVKSIFGLTMPMAYTQPEGVLPNNGAYESWPCILTAADGSLILAYGSGTAHVAGDAVKSAIYRRSTDGGVSWSSSYTFTVAGRDHFPYSTGVAPNGHLISVVRSVAVGNTLDWKYQVLRSTDNGITWATVGSRVTWTYNPMVIGPAISLQSGHMLALWSAGPGTEGNSPDYVWGVMRSLDNGATWTQEVKYLSQLTPPSVEDMMLEGRLWQASDGTIVAIARGIHTSISTNNGVNFTYRADTNMSAGGAPPVLVSNGDENLTVYYWDRNDDTLHMRTGSLSKIKTNPLAWDAEDRVIARGLTNTYVDAGYAHACVTPSGDHKVVYYAGQIFPTVYLMTGSRSSNRLTIATRAQMEIIDRFDLNTTMTNAAVTTTSTAGTGGVFLADRFLWPEMLQRGVLYARFAVKVANSVAGASVKLRLTSARGTEAEFTVPCPVADTIYSAMSGWIELPNEFLANGSSVSLATMHQITMRAVVTSGTGTIYSSTQAQIGAKVAK